jgi:C4-dicarboxylate transporter, DctQ subunit
MPWVTTMIERLEDVNDHIDWLVKWIIIIAMVIIPAAMTLQVVMRYLFNYPLPWPEEGVRFAFIWLVFMSACAALRRGELVALGFVIQRLSPSMGFILIIVGRASILVFLAFAIYSGMDMTAHVFGRSTNSPVLQIPIWIVYISLPVGCLFMGFQVILHLIHQFRGTTPRRPPGIGLAHHK